MSKAETTGLDPVRAKRQAREQFEAWAETYDRSPLNRFLFRPSHVVFMEEVARWHAERKRDFVVLDVGCGTGTFVGLLAASRWPVRVVGLDYAPTMCAAAAGKVAACGLGHAAQFTAGDSEHLPFADGSFDLITCSNSFHHYPHQQVVVSEMRRLLRPGGRLIIIDGFRDNVIGWFVFDVIIHRVEQDVYHAPWSVIQEYFVQAGLRGIRRRKFNLWFPLLATIGDAP
ncbi:MAG TPA: class I SAM-dependent methyltransferase [Phycisphaerae bacterium]|nr:class I SAM-dependent methyltransferase [Phycisphaerae bacterium]